MSAVWGYSELREADLDELYELRGFVEQQVRDRVLALIPLAVGDALRGLRMSRHYEAVTADVLEDFALTVLEAWAEVEGEFDKLERRAGDR